MGYWLHGANVFHSRRVVPPASNNWKVMDIEDAFNYWNYWQGLPKVAE